MSGIYFVQGKERKGDEGEKENGRKGKEDREKRNEMEGKSVGERVG